MGKAIEVGRGLAQCKSLAPSCTIDERLAAGIFDMVSVIA